MSKELKCSICDKSIRPSHYDNGGYGFNPHPVASGRCCSDCDNSVVIPARLDKIIARANR